MNRESGAFTLPWIYKRQDALQIDGIFSLAMGLAAFVLVLVAALLVIFLAQPEISPAIADGIGFGSARWSVSGDLYSPDNEKSKEASVAQARFLEEAYARSMALKGLGWVGPLVGSPSAPAVALAPRPEDAFARSTAMTGQGGAGLVGDT